MASARPLPLPSLHRRLLRAYGPQHWWPGDTPFEVMTGALLTQNTAWTSVEKAIGELKHRRALTPRGLLALPLPALEAAVRPSGYFRQKAARLRGLARWYLASCGGRVPGPRRDTDQLRAELLALPGVGPETADSILLYAFRRPLFVVDAYTRRILFRLGHLPGEETPYHRVQELFHRALPAEEPLFNELHALLVRHAKERCRKRAPRCGRCPVGGSCPAREMEAAA